MLDAALIGSATTGVLALLAQMIAKCKCYVACKKDEDDEICEPRLVCGFLDTPLGELILPEGKDETSCDRPTPAAA